MLILTLFGGDGESAATPPLSLLLLRIPALGEADGEYTLGTMMGRKVGLFEDVMNRLGGGELEESPLL